MYRLIIFLLIKSKTARPQDSCARPKTKTRSFLARTRLRLRLQDQDQDHVSLGIDLAFAHH